MQHGAGKLGAIVAPADDIIKHWDSLPSKKIS
jgi:hypothetical protein